MLISRIKASGRIVLSVLCLLALPGSARAEFIISSAIVEFAGDGPRQQDIELIT